MSLTTDEQSIRPVLIYLEKDVDGDIVIKARQDETVANIAYLCASSGSLILWETNAGILRQLGFSIDKDSIALW